MSSSLTGPTEWMNSSMAERRLVKPGVESSNLSSSSEKLTVACSLMVRAVALYAKGCWFESSQANKKYKPVAQRERR